MTTIDTSNDDYNSESRDYNEEPKERKPKRKFEGKRWDSLPTSVSSLVLLLPRPTSVPRLSILPSAGKKITFD